MFKTHRRMAGTILITLLMVLALALPAWAVQVSSDNMVTIPIGKVKGPLFVAGDTIVVDADVDGDVFAAGNSITINGSVRGDIIAAGQNIYLNSKVEGDVRCAASQVEIRGEITESLSAAAASIRTLPESRIGRDATIFAGQIDLSGKIEDQLLGNGGTMKLNGPVGGSVKLWEVGDLTIGPSAMIGGELNYASSKTATISPEAKIQGAAKWQEISKPQPSPAAVENEDRSVNWTGEFIWFAGGVLIWGLGYLLFPRLWTNLSRIVQSSGGPALGWGLLMLLVTPLAILLFTITIIGIPIAMVLLMIYILLLYAAKIMIGDAIGRALSRHFSWEGRVHMIIPFILGFVSLILLTNIPVVGFLINVAVACLALGAILLSFLNWRKPADSLPPVIQEQ